MRHSFLTSTTYGTWLPGDARGSVSNAWRDGPREFRNEVDTPYDEFIPELLEASRDRLRYDPVYFAAEHAPELVDQFRETATHRGWTLHGAAVMCNHVHLLVAVADDPDPWSILGDFKSYGSRRLNRVFGRRPEWWTDKGSKRKKKDARAILAALRYLRDQPAALAVWLNPDSHWVRRIDLPTDAVERGHEIF